MSATPASVAAPALPRSLYFGDGLFSTHYLQQRLPTTDIWSDETEADAAFDMLIGVYAAVGAAIQSGNEEDVEDRIVAPVLSALGYGAEKRRIIPGATNRQFPDFLLYNSPAEAQAAFQSANYYAACVGLLEAKQWNVRLEQLATNRGRSPHLQLRDYLNERPELGWGILTNGGEWRLYARAASASQYFGVNLAAILADDTLGNVETTI